MLSEILCIAVLNLGMPNGMMACDHMEDVVDAAETNLIEPALLVSLIYHESRWTPTAVSPSGACGLTQVLPQYTKNPKLTCKQLKNPKTSIYTGAQVLGLWLGKYKMGKALCAYNAGYTCGKRYRKTHQGWRYSRKVLRYAGKIQKQLNIINAQYDDEGC